MRRLSTKVLLVVPMLCVVSIFAGQASATKPTPSRAVQVVKVSGLIDPITADFLTQSVAEAEMNKAPAIVLRINSSGSVLHNDRLIRLAHTLHDSNVPILAWVGPSGSKAMGAAAQLIAVVDHVGVAPGSVIGQMGEVIIPKNLWTTSFRDSAETLRDGVMGAEQADAAGLTVPRKNALVLRRMLLEVPGFSPKTTGTTRATPIQFTQLSTGQNLMHTFASPAVAQLLFVFGLCLLVFELFTAGVGVAGLCGAAFVIFGSYGLGVLPVRAVAVAAIVGSMVAFAVDVQVGTPRVWTGAGAVALGAGMMTLFTGVPTPWISTLLVFIAAVVFMVFGMPAMTRSRFSTPVIERDFLIGRSGVVTSALDADGVIEVGEARWAARADEPTIPVGAQIKVVGIEGVICRVETVSTPVP